MTADTTGSGWAFVAEADEAASLFGALVDLDAAETHSKSDIADAAGVPMKTLYLLDTLGDLEDLEVLERVEEGDSDSEVRFRVAESSPVLEAARAFDRAVDEQLPGSEPP